MTDMILQTENLKKSFGKLEVLKGISTGIRRGEVVSIIGPSGGGKSTLLGLLGGVLRLLLGRVFAHLCTSFLRGLHSGRC